MGSTASWRTVLLGLLLITATVASFSPVLRNDFLNWDDQDTLWANPNFNPPTADGIARYWREPAGELYIPITYTVWAALAKVAYSSEPTPDGIRLNAAIFHAASILLHIAATLVVFIILRRIVGSDFPAFAGAMLFALHPLQVESVAWASGMKDVLCGLLSLIALDQFLRFAQANPLIRNRRWVHYAIATIAFILAMLAKPSAAVVPLSAAVLAFWLAKKPSKQLIGYLSIWILLAIPVVIVARLVQTGNLVVSPVISRPLVAADSLAWYLFKLLVPVRLAVDYGWSPDWLIRQPMAYVIWILPAIVAALAWHYRKRWPWGLAALGLFISPLFPVLGLMTFSYQYDSTVADHYLYAAMLGPALFVAFAMSRVTGRGATVVAICAGIGLGSLSFIQCRRWRDTSTLFTYALSVNPASLAAHRNLGYLLSSRGEILQAIDQYQLALQTRPDDPMTHFNLGNLFLRQKEALAAIPHYRAALRVWPTDSRLHHNLGIAYQSVGLAGPAACEFGWMLYYHGDYLRAADQFRKAIQIDPNIPEAHEGLQEVSRHLSSG